MLNAIIINMKLWIIFAVIWPNLGDLSYLGWEEAAGKAETSGNGGEMDAEINSKDNEHQTLFFSASKAVVIVACKEACNEV